MAREGPEATRNVKSATPKAKRGARPLANKRTANPEGLGGKAPANTDRRSRSQEQDVKRRLGDYAGTATHPRTSARSTGNFARSKKANTGTKRA